MSYGGSPDRIQARYHCLNQAVLSVANDKNSLTLLGKMTVGFYNTRQITCPKGVFNAPELPANRNGQIIRRVVPINPFHGVYGIPEQLGHMVYPHSVLQEVRGARVA